MQTLDKLISRITSRSSNVATIES